MQQHRDTDFGFYAGAVFAVLVLTPFYLGIVIWWLS
jgi:hypothetical protein